MPLNLKLFMSWSVLQKKLVPTHFSMWCIIRIWITHSYSFSYLTLRVLELGDQVDCSFPFYLTENLHVCQSIKLNIKFDLRSSPFPTECNYATYSSLASFPVLVLTIVGLCAFTHSLS